MIMFKKPSAKIMKFMAPRSGVQTFGQNQSATAAKLMYLILDNLLQIAVELIFKYYVLDIRWS